MSRNRFQIKSQRIIIKIAFNLQLGDDQENESADQPSQDAPVFVQPEAEHTISEEEELVLEVKTTGKPHTVKWFFCFIF